MNPYRKAAALFLRLIALGLILVPVILVGLDFFAARTSRTPRVPASKLSMILKVGAIASGVVLFFASGTIARKLTEDLEE